MELSHKQEAILLRYLRDVALKMDHGLSDAQKEQAVAGLEAQIRRTLKTFGSDSVSDENLQTVLERLGAPQEVAQRLAEQTDTQAQPKKKAQPVWLGVCRNMAERAGLETWMVRLLFVLLGLVTGPLALLIYAGFYAEMYLSTEPLARPRIDWLRIAGRGAGFFVVALGLDWGVQYFLRFVDYAVVEVLKREVPPLGEWGWLEVQADSLFFWAVIISVPLGAFSGLPLANGWDYSLKRIAQAALALYAIALSFGVASVIVGLILAFVEEFSGFGILSL